MKFDIEYAQWETEGGTTPEQNEARPQSEFTHPTLVVSDDCPQPRVESGEGDIPTKVT